MDRALLLLLWQSEFSANSVSIMSYTHSSCTYKYVCPSAILNI